MGAGDAGDGSPRRESFNYKALKVYVCARRRRRPSMCSATMAASRELNEAVEEEEERRLCRGRAMSRTAKWREADRLVFD